MAMGNLLFDKRDRFNRKHFAGWSAAFIIIISMILNVWGNKWGAPDYWHPDELTRHSIKMLDKRSLNPGVFYYGNLHYCVLLTGAVIPARIYTKIFDPIPDKANLPAIKLWAKRLEARTIILARSISAIMAALQVLIVYFLGVCLFDKWIGLLSALFLAIFPYFIAIAHFATVDTAANFWYWFSCLLCLLYWKKGNKKWYVLASIVAGLAIGTKIDRIVILVPIFLSHLFYEKGLNLKPLISSLFFLTIGYIVATPMLFISFFEFIDGFSRDTFFNIMRGESGETSYIKIIYDIKNGMGLPMFIITISGIVFAVCKLLNKEKRKEIIWLFSCIMPYYFIVGSRFSIAWYVIFFYPVLAVFAAYLMVYLYKLSGYRYKILISFLSSSVVIYTLLCSITILLQFSYDSRYLSSRWIKENIPINASIEIGQRGPKINDKNYKIVKRSLALNYDALEKFRLWGKRLDDHRAYKNIREIILNTERWAEKKIGITARKDPYVAWFDRAQANYKKDTKKKEEEQIRTTDFDYIVLVDYLDNKKLRQLQKAESNYILVKNVHYKNPFGIKTQFSFVNPTVYIYKKKTFRSSFKTSHSLV